MHLRARHSLVALVVTASAVLLPTPAVAAATDTVVATHLDAPRGVTFLHGHLVVAEAGHGGPACDGPQGAPGTTCIGTTSRLSRVNLGSTLPEPIVSGLFSALEWHAPGAPPDALGLDGISADEGRVLGILALAPQLLEGITCLPASAGADCRKAKRQAGHLISASADGTWRDVAPVGKHDYAYTVPFPPATQEHDSNPYGVLAGEAGTYVADAGSNTLDRISSSGRVSIVHRFPFHQKAFPADEVPDCIAQADGALWVGTLAGHVFRITGDDAVRVSAPLLKHVTGCTSDKSGNLYFVNMWTSPNFPAPNTGNVIKWSADKETWSQVNTAPLDFPNMIAVGPDGDLYVSADSVCPASGAPFCPLGGTIHRLETTD